MDMTYASTFQDKAVITPYPTYRIIKRLCDIIFGLISLMLVSPFLVIIAALIRIDSAGPIIFTQIRCGYKNRPFVIYKFRTLYHHCRCNKGGEQIIQNDQRLTRIGKFLRSYSLDELPQIFNIIKGDMSFVGPRPHAISHHRYYRQYIPHYNQRLTVTPGLTGLAQINGLRGPTPDIDHMARRFKCDRDYIAQCSFRLDLYIIMQTLIKGAWREK